MDLVDMTADTFSACLNQTFSVASHDGGDALGTLELTAVDVKSNPGARRQPFALTFRRAGAERLPQSIYRLEHPDLGILAIFMVPVEGGDDHVLYESVFT